jgi:hypothetical protein
MGSQYFEVHLVENKSRNAIWTEVVRYLDPWILGTRNVIELGAGYCSFINAIKSENRVATDIDPIIEKYADSKVATVVIDLKELILNKDSLDLALASNVFEHLDRSVLIDVLEKIHDGLKVYGKLIIIQPNYKYAYRKYFDDHTHVAIYTEKSLSNILRIHGFKITHIEKKFMPYSMNTLPKFIPNRVLKLAVRVYLNIPFRPKAQQMLIIAEK